MKKFIALALALVMALGLVACGNNPTDTGAANTEDTGSVEATPVVLADFYTAKYDELYPLDAEGNATGPYADDMAIDAETLEMLYPGLAAVETAQIHAYVPMMTAVAYEVVLVEVVNEADVETVKGILQARIDSQVAGGGWYPAVTEGWTNDSRIVSNGNYIMLAVGTDCDSFVESFNALFN